MNLAEEINAVIRRIATSGEWHQVILERVFDTDMADLWHACTDPGRLSRWLEPVRGDLVPGGRYSLTSSGTEGDILRCRPPRHLSVSWEYQGHVSTVDVELIPAAPGRTVLRLAHLCPPDDHWTTYGPAATGVGWEDSLRALSLLVGAEDGGVAGAVERIAGTPEGRRLTRLASDAWGRVDRDTGTLAGDAETRARRTAAFYLGHPTNDDNA